MSELENKRDEPRRAGREDAPPEHPRGDLPGVGERGRGWAGPKATPDVWTTAALAHGSILLTLLLAFAGGVGAFVGLLVPLVLYLSYRERSRFVAFHALQALLYQGVGVLVYLVLATVLALAVTVAWAVSGLLSVVLVGILLIPLALLITFLTAIVLVGAPLVWVVYGLYAAYEVYQGKDFHYWRLGTCVEREVDA